MRMQEQIRDAGATAPDLDTRVGEAVAIAGLYRFLGRCLEEEIDRELLRALRGSFGHLLLEVGWTMDSAFLEGPEDELLEQLAEEFTGLFVAPGGVSPYASVFETGCMYREPCDQVMAAYREAGWDYRRQLTGEFPDHIGTMLCFLGELAAKESQSLEQEDVGSVDAWAERRRTFLLDQLGRWAPGWCRRAARAALLPFYQQVLQFTEQLLWQQLSEVADRRGIKELVEFNQREPKKLDYDADFRKASGI